MHEEQDDRVLGCGSGCSPALASDEYNAARAGALAACRHSVLRTNAPILAIGKMRHRWSMTCHTPRVRKCRYPKRANDCAVSRYTNTSRANSSPTTRI